MLAVCYSKLFIVTFGEWPAVGKPFVARYFEVEEDVERWRRMSIYVLGIIFWIHIT